MRRPTSKLKRIRQSMNACLTLDFSQSVDISIVSICLLGFIQCARCDSNIVCMEQQEMLTCNTAGTLMSSIALMPDCLSQPGPGQGQQGPVASKPTGVAITGPNNLSRAKQCPCKSNYSGLKCDTCSDGLYMRFHHFREDQPPDHHNSRQRDDNKLRPATVYHRHGNSSSSTRKSHRSFSCQPCNCDPIGAKSFNCDKRNGTCFCVDGYMGTKCDKCSIGYYNISAALFDPLPDMDLDRSQFAKATRRRQCVECGECFDQWHVRAIDLKDTSVELIKRAFELTSLSGSPMMDQQSDLILYQQPQTIDWKNGHSAGLFDRWGNFDELEEKFRSVSEKLFANKHNSDRLNLLAGELESIKRDYHQTHSNVTHLTRMRDRLDVRILKADYHLRYVSSLVTERLAKLVDKFVQDQIDAQEDLPRGALLLIRMHSNESLATRETSDRFQQESKPQLEALSASLRAEVASLNRSHLKLQEYGLKIFNVTLNSYRFENISSLLEHSILQDRCLNSGPDKGPHLLDQTVALALLEKDLKSRARNYHDMCMSDENDLIKLESTISKLLNTLDSVDSSLNSFHSSWLDVVTLNRSANIQDIEPWSIYADFEHSLRSLQANSDRFEVRSKNLDEVANEIISDEATSSRSRIILTLRNLTREINTTMSSKQSHWNEFELTHKGELLQLNSLKKRASVLAHESANMSKTINLLEDMDKEINHLQEAASLIIDKTNQDKASLLASLANYSLDLKTSLSQDYESKQRRIMAIRDAYLRGKTKLIERDLIHNYQANRIRSHIDEVSSEQSYHLFNELKRGSSELSNILDVAKGNTMRLSSDTYNGTVDPNRSLTERELKFSHKLRAHKLVEGIEQLVRSLVTMTSSTSGLSEKFQDNERILAEQNKTLHLLQDEIELLTAELELNLANCSSQCRTPMN